MSECAGGRYWQPVGVSVTARSLPTERAFAVWLFESFSPNCADATALLGGRPALDIGVGGVLGSTGPRARFRVDGEPLVSGLCTEFGCG